MKLSSFSLNAKDCASLISVQGLGEAVLKMASSLQHVHLNFHGCRDLLFDASMTELKQTLESGAFPCLEQVTLYLAVAPDRPKYWQAVKWFSV